MNCPPPTDTVNPTWGMPPDVNDVVGNLLPSRTLARLSNTDPQHPLPTLLPLNHCMTNPTLISLQQALASADLTSLTNIVHSLLTCRTSDNLTPISGSDGHPLFLETVALFCWGNTKITS